MRVRRLAALAAAVLATVVAPAPARAQGADPLTFAHGRVTFGGDVSGAISPRDRDGYFNLSDDNQNLLRQARLRVAGEWRITSRVSFLGEVRAANGPGVEAAAWYVRWRPWAAHALDVQIGRIPPVVGLFARQPFGRENPLIGAPLAYQYVTSLRPDALPATVDDLLRMRGLGWSPNYPVGAQTAAPGLPLVSAFRWDTGGEARWTIGWVEMAGALTLGSPAFPIVGRDLTEGLSPSGRIAVNTPAGLSVGLSGARGAWIESSTLRSLPTAVRDRSTQAVVGLDVTFGRGRWLLRAEELRTTFELPLRDQPDALPHLSATATFLEARYRLSPRWQLAARLERLDFSTVTGVTEYYGRPKTWDAPMERLETTVGFRVLRNLELRAGWQMNWRDGGLVTRRGYPVGQFLYWF